MGSAISEPAGATSDRLTIAAWVRWSATLTALAVAATGCSTARTPEPPVRLETTAAGTNTRVTLIPAAHIKLNARLKPALELADGSVLRFDSERLTPDSAYFAEPPVAVLRGKHARVRGILRASICENDAPVCRALVLEL